LLRCSGFVRICCWRKATLLISPPYFREGLGVGAAEVLGGFRQNVLSRAINIDQRARIAAPPMPLTGDGSLRSPTHPLPLPEGGRGKKKG
jgi:hypothetical protein